MSLTKQEIQARNRLLKIADRLKYTFTEDNTYIFHMHIEDENVQFLIKTMYDCMTVLTTLSELREKIKIAANGANPYDENLIPSRFKMFFYTEKYLLEYLDSKLEVE